MAGAGTMSGRKSEVSITTSGAVLIVFSITSAACAGIGIIAKSEETSKATRSFIG